MRATLPLLTTLTLTAGALGACGHTDNNDDMTARLDSILTERYADCPAAPGAAVIIARGDSVIYERYFGKADMATGEDIGPETLFNIASVSKQFTVAALLQQREVDIDSPVSDWFDYPQPFWHDITLAHLASHSSGVPDSRDRSDRERCVYADDESSAAYFPTVDSLRFAPGTAYDYLNPSFILLAKVVEQVTGREFTAYMRDSVFTPAGMASTVYFSPSGMPAHTSHGYVPEGEGWKEYDYGEETFFATRPDGGIYSTARDMLSWERALARGTVLAADKRDLAYTPRVDVASSPWCDYQRRPRTWYGLGWFVETGTPLGTKVYHTGDNGGYQAYVAKYPEHDLAVIVLENRNDRDRQALATAIEHVLSERLR